MENPYESSRYLAEYLLFHYAAESEILPWPFGPKDALHFPRRTVAAFARQGVKHTPNSRALDLGCAVGASSFAMAEYFGHVTGLDFSHSFINAAQALRDGQTLTYERLDEGGLSTTLQVSPPLPNLAQAVDFRQGDAMDLPEEWCNFDAVHAANLLCRLPEPMRLIKRLPKLLKPGGILVLATPCSWLEAFTPQSAWLGGYSENGVPVATIDRLQTLLSPDFEALEQRDEPFLIREHSRKFQWSVALVSTWRRRS